MTPELAVQFAATLLCVGVAAIMGFMCGRGVRRELQKQIADLRADIKEREKFMASRAKREDEIIKSCFEKAGVYAQDDQANRVIDRSPQVVAKRLRLQREKQEQQAEWDRHNGSERGEPLAAAQ